MNGRTNLPFIYASHVHWWKACLHIFMNLSNLFPQRVLENVERGRRRHGDCGSKYGSFRAIIRCLYILSSATAICAFFQSLCLSAIPLRSSLWILDGKALSQGVRGNWIVVCVRWRRVSYEWVVRAGCVSKRICMRDRGPTEPAVHGPAKCISHASNFLRSAALWSFRIKM